MLEAAYSAAIGSAAPAYPADVRPAWRSVELKRIVPGYRSRMPLQSGEFDDLASREDAYRTERFEPRCAWEGTPTPHVDDEGHRMDASFSSPIFSTDGRLALVEVSFDDRGGFGYGMICVVRAGEARWSARCLDSWIT